MSKSRAQILIEILDPTFGDLHSTVPGMIEHLNGVGIRLKQHQMLVGLANLVAVTGALPEGAPSVSNPFEADLRGALAIEKEVDERLKDQKPGWRRVLGRAFRANSNRIDGP